MNRKTKGCATRHSPVVNKRRKSAGDVRRARERAAEKRGREAERRKANSDFLQEKLEAARELLAEGLSIEKVCRIQKLTEAQVKSL